MEKYRTAEPDAEAIVTDIVDELSVFSESDSKKIVDLISKIPTGVYKMSEDIRGLVETSSNLGVVTTDGGRVKVSVSVRSSKNAEKQNMIEKIKDIARGFGVSVGGRGEYPAWEYKSDSRLRDLCCEIYREKYGKEPTVLIIHAGLECGLFSNNIKDLDCISIGPDMSSIHTTEEKLSLSSSARVFEFIKEVLKRI